MPDNNKINIDEPVKIAPHVGKSISVNDNEYVAGKFGNTDFGKSKLDDPNTTSEFIIDHSYEDTRGNKQPILDKWGNGLIKAAGVAGTSILENTAGLLYGIADATVEKDVSKLYNNPFTQTLDQFNKYVADNLPNYHTKAEQDYNLAQKLGTANFWSDQFLNGAAFMGAAVATGTGLSKFASIAKLARMGTVIDEAALATKGWSELDKAAKIVRFADAADFGKNALLMSHGESAIEARQTLNDTKNQLISEYKAKTGQDPDAATMDYIERTAAAAGNAGYATNLAITGTTNALLFPKILSKGYAANKRKLNNIESQGTKYVAETENLFKGISKATLLGSAEEGGQELAQLITQKTLTDYYGRAFRDKKDQHSFVESLAEGMKQSMGEEGLENFFLGAIMGGPAAFIQSRGEIKQQNAATENIATLLNNPSIKKTANTFDNYVRATSYEADKNEALQKGSKFDYLSAEFNQNKAIAKIFIDNNASDILIDQYKAMKTMSESEFKKVAGYDENTPLPKTQGEIIDNAIKFVEQLNKTNDAIQTLFPYSEEEHGTPDNYKMLTDNLWHYSTSIENMDKRTKELHNDLMKIALDNSVTIKGTGTTEDPFGIEGNPLAAEQVNQINEDLHVAKVYKDALIDAYKQLADPKTRKETLDKLKEDAKVKNEESNSEIKDEKAENEIIDNPVEKTTDSNTSTETPKTKVEKPVETVVDPVKAIKEDIEKRRQEELKGEEYRTTEKSELYQGDNGTFYKVEQLKNGKNKVSIADENGRTLSILEEFDNSVSLDTIINDKEGSYGSAKEGRVKLTKQKDLKFTNRIVDKINAKYDAELKALEQKSTTTQTAETTQSNIESKKADIEKRRKLDLFKNTPEQAFSGYANDTKLTSYNEEGAITDRKEGKSLTGNRIQIFKTLIDLLTEAFPEKYQSLKNIFKPNPSGNGYYITINDFTKAINILKKEGINTSKEGLTQLLDLKKQRISEINAKYDAELQALESTATTETSIEAKKADIERRRQEELDENNFRLVDNVKTYEGIDPETGEIFQARVKTYKDGKKEIQSNIGGKFSTLNKGFPKEVNDEKLLEGIFEDNKMSLVKDQNQQEFLLEQSSGKQNTHAIEDKINAKYDAELAKLNKDIIKSTNEADEDAISNNAKTNTINNTTGDSQNNIDTPVINNVLEVSKGINLRNNVVMMHLFNHVIKDGTFKFLRDSEGYIQVDNTSDINIPELNNVKVGDSVELKLVTLTKEQSDKNNANIDESLKHPSVKKEDFDNEAIGIYSNGNLIGFVQEPHASITEYKPTLVNGKVVPVLQNKTEAEAVRKSLIEYRKSVIAKLKAGEIVTEKVEEKGNGNLYTKLQPNGIIDANRDVFNTSRPKDVRQGALLFAYHNGDRMVLPQSRLTDKEAAEMDTILSNFDKYGKKGEVFQVVQDLTGSYSLIPVYANKINDATASKIIELLKGFTNETKSRDIVQAVNKYIYASTTKNTTMKVHAENSKIIITVNTEKYNLEDINESTTIANNFKKALLTQSQNISAENLNNKVSQEDMKERNTLVSNVLEYQGEYFVQPFISYSHTLKSTPQPKPTLIDEIIAEAVQSNTDEKTVNIDSIFDPNEALNSDDALSTSKSDGTLDIKKFEKWKNKNLPQLSMADAKQTADALARLKANMVDAYGMFKDLTIFLFDKASNKTAYHEAFHGVFRNILNLEEKHAILKEAINKYEAPTKEQLEELQKGLSKEYNDKQLTYLYYEEKLADDFAEYTNSYNERSIGQKILDFFKKILDYFNIFTNHNTDAIDDLFNKVNTGSFKSKSIVKTSKNANLEVFNKPFEVFDDSYAYSKDLDRIFGVNEKSILVKKIGNQFLAIHQSNIEQGIPSKAFNIHKDIRSKYEEFFNKEEAKRKNNEPFDKKSWQYAGLAAHWYPHLQKEVEKYLSFRNVDSSVDFVKPKEGIVEEDLGDVEITSLRSATTKGLEESTSIAGVRSASTRMKIFLSSIPVLENGVEKKDIYGITEYYPFDKLYYYIETNLTGIYDFQEQLDKLRELGENKPEIQQVVNKLTNKSSLIDDDEFKLLQNDFKTNFSKQQLAYTMIQFFTDAVSGKVTYKIFDANRESIFIETRNKWEDNLKDSSRKTIAEIDNTTGIVNMFNTSKGIALKDQWSELVKNKTTLNKDVVNKVLSKLGIELSPITLEAIIDTPVFKNSVSQLLNWYASDNTNGAIAETGRQALNKLVNFETTNVMNNYTSSFNNVENKNIYTVQLPSWASKMMSVFNSDNTDKFEALVGDLQRDPILKYSNILKDLLESDKYRKSSFKLSYLDGLKDGNGDSKGVKFTTMTPKDYFNQQIALFQNKFSNQGKTLADTIAKYIYITPSDKSMSMIIDAKVYGVSFKSLDTKNSKGGNLDLNENSEIFDRFYRVYLGESERIKHNTTLVDDILTSKDLKRLKGLLQYYHISRNNWDNFTNLVENKKELTEAEWKQVASYIDGAAFKYNYFSESFNKIAQDPNVNSSDILARLKIDLKQEVDSIRDEMIEENIITRENGFLKSVSLDIDGADELEVHNNINQFVASYALNSKLFNIEMSNLFNGDFAQYKPGDLQKRTYQSQAMYTNGLWTRPTVNVVVKKDVYTSSESNESDYKKINVTDAQVFSTPEFYKEFLIANGRWSKDHDKAYAILEGTSKPKQIDEALQVIMGAIKPYSTGSRFDKDLGIQRFEQVKCSILPLFKAYTDINPLLKEKREELKAKNADMIAFESAFKDAIGFRSDITNSDDLVLPLETSNLGIQVDNPEHILDAENDSLRQLKMLLIGSVNSTKSYNGRNGKEIVDQIIESEATNIRESLRELEEKISDKTNSNFIEFIKDMVTKRGTTSNVEELFRIEDGEFVYPLDNGAQSTQVENMVSSIFTNQVIKQPFGVGGSGVQATSLGLKFRDFAEQQESLTNDALLVQQELKWIKPDGKGGIEYAECAMPGWSKKFFDKNGYLKDINNIPDELKQLVMYRIPTEGLHSMLPIKVVKFLPETMGNFILLPYEVTQQFGADFDFDKMYFIGKEFYTDRKTGNLIPYTISEDVKERYKQYLEYTHDSKLDQVDYDTFKQLPLDQQVTRAARNNSIISNYLHLLTSIENYDLIKTPSGFEDLVKIKKDYFNEGNRGGDSFFSSRTQRDYKNRNHVGIALKGQWALHVSGHSYAVLMNLSTELLDKNGLLDKTRTINFNNISSTFDRHIKDGVELPFNKINSINNSLIADKIASIMAGVLDDIKDPLLAYLGINKYTTDVAAAIMRSGHNIDTAIKFIAQAGIKDMSKLLDANYNKVKIPGQRTYSISDIIEDYTTLMNNAVEETDSSISENTTFTNAIEATKEKAPNINDSEMEYHLGHFRFKTKGPVSVLQIKEGEKYRDATSDEKALYYAFQIRCLKAFDNYSKIANELVDMNKIFAINKEVGPNIENIIAKKQLLDEIMGPDRIFKGFDIDTIPTLKETYNAQMGALEFFNDYFPYDSAYYNSVKAFVNNTQTSTALSKLKVEDKIFMNSFIRTYMDGKFDKFSDIPYKYEDLFVSLPKILEDIMNPFNKDKTIGNITYEKLRTNNLFLNALKINKKYFDRDGVYYITLKGNRLDQQVKEDLITSFKNLYNNPNTKELAKMLIEYSFASTGFYTGLNSYSALISPEILADLEYSFYRSGVINQLNNEDIALTSEDMNRIKDQLVRNTPKMFTKVFDSSIFKEDNDTNALPKTINTSPELIKAGGKAKDMILQSSEDMDILTQYIRVFDKGLGRPTLYKNIAIGSYTYERVNTLGRKGFFIEINPFEDIIDSFIKSNNSNKPSVKTEEEDANDENSGEILAEDSGKSMSDPNQTSIFGDIINPKDVIDKPSKKDDDNLPNDIKPCNI